MRTFSEYMMAQLHLNESDMADANKGTWGDTEHSSNSKENDLTTQTEVEEADMSDFPEDDSGFSYGEIKLDTPKKEGLAAAISAADQFAKASDGQNTDVNLSFHDSFPKDESGFEEDANLVSEFEEEPVAADTVPNTTDEDDQFEPETPDGEPATEDTDKSISAAELAADDDDIDMAGGDWEDLM